MNTIQGNSDLNQPDLAKHLPKRAPAPPAPGNGCENDFALGLGVVLIIVMLAVIWALVFYVPHVKP